MIESTPTDPQQSRICKMSRWLFVVWLMGLCAGCASVESTMVTRDEMNQNWERHNCLNGIPITLKVPTHLKLYVFHQYFLQTQRASPAPASMAMAAAGSPAAPPAEEPAAAPAADPAPGAATAATKGKVINYNPVDVGVVVRDFAQELMYTDKVFVVDFKRPASGSSNLKVQMTDEQYIDRIQHDITDNTIDDVKGLIAAASGENFVTATDKSDAVKSGDLIPIRSLVAVGIFEIESPDFERKVREFMECHVNKSHDAWVMPPGVNHVNRVSLGPHENRELPYPPTPLCSPCAAPFSAGGVHPAPMENGPTIIGPYESLPSSQIKTLRP